MRKSIISIISVFLLPNMAQANVCADYDREIGVEIGKVFYTMRQHYLKHDLPHASMDRIMTEIHKKYNEEYELAFQIAARHSPTECVVIRNIGIEWVRSYEEIIQNELNTGN